MRLHYGVWDGVVYDNRGTADYKEPEGLDLKKLLPSLIVVFGPNPSQIWV